MGCYGMQCVSHMSTASYSFADMTYKPLGITITNLNTQLSHEGMKTTLDDHFVKNVASPDSSEL